MACAIRTARHEIFDLTPYFVLFGRSMCLSGEDYRHEPLDGVEGDGSEQSKPRCEQFRALFELVRAKLEAANSRAAKLYNLRRRLEEYDPDGQLLWRRNFALFDASKHFTSKLAPKYVGPYYVYKRISPWTYTLKDEAGKILEGSWHAKDLKKGPGKDED